MPKTRISILSSPPALEPEEREGERSDTPLSLLQALSSSPGSYCVTLG